MKKLVVITIIASIVLTCTLCTKYDKYDDAYEDPRLSGGLATTFNSGTGAFGDMIVGLSPYDEFVHEVGDKLFEQTFISAPAPLFQGLGPIYNNVSCVSCHHNDGKGVPVPGSVKSGMLTKLSIEGGGAHNAPIPVPGYGLQLQDRAVSGKVPEGKIDITYESVLVTFPDGHEVSLRKPIVTFRNLYAAFPSDARFSVRLGPAVFGLGLLDLISESDIISHVDESDLNNDGISGKANYVWNPQTGQTEIGRFGLKANHASLMSQIATAFHQDMGVTNHIFSQESSFGQSQYDGRDDEVEITDSMLNAVVFYIQTLAVPARRSVDNETVLQGERLFRQINCSGCHLPSVRTGVDVRLPTLSNQLIQPFTDLLLHDMGPDLADHRDEYLADGSEWRTAPLWGIGLLRKVNGTSSFYLHDGRARTLEEAILWHGGEAQDAKQKFMNLNAQERAALIKFLESL